MTGHVRTGEGHVLTSTDKTLLGLWLLPVALGLAVGWRTGDDEGQVLLFVTALVAVLYLVVTAGMLHHARYRRRWADVLGAGGPAGPDLDEDPAASPAGAETLGERGRRVAVRALPLLVVIPAAVHLVVAEGGWTFVVIAAQLITVVTMAAHVHASAAEPGPAVP
ncbi:hypothetical protein [Kocuria sabuli]|uniref:hypothetical protein n=1 Tax=Kocuria sabuli TaxID=3071448 RepID=UPI0034D65225